MLVFIHFFIVHSRRFFFTSFVSDTRFLALFDVCPSFVLWPYVLKYSTLLVLHIAQVRLQVGSPSSTQSSHGHSSIWMVRFLTSSYGETR